MEASKGASILGPSGAYAGFLVLAVALGYIASTLRQAEKSGSQDAVGIMLQ